MNRPCTGGIGMTLVMALGVMLVGCSNDRNESVDHDALADRRVACVGCHGETGIARAPAFPIIAGQPTGYLEHAMTAYRDGARDNAIMNAQMQGFSDAEIHALAVYYHRQDSPLARHVGRAGARDNNTGRQTP